MDQPSASEGGGWLSRRQGLRGAALWALCATIAAKLFGLTRDILVAHFFGASIITDGFYLALIAPMLIMTSVASSVGTAIVPIGTEIHTREGFEGLRRFAGSIFQLGLILGIGIGALLGFAAPWVIAAIGPGAGSMVRDEAIADLLLLAVWTAGQIVFFTFVGIFHSRRSFVVPSVGWALEPMATIAILLCAVQFGVGNPIALSWGLGAVVTVAVLFVCFASVFKYRPTGRLSFRETRSMLALMLPVLVASALGTLYPAIDRAFGATLSIGSVTALSYGYMLVNVPIYLLAIPGSTVALPFLAERAGAADASGVHEILEKYARAAILMLIPIMAFTVVYATELVQWLFERGKFTSEDTRITAMAVQGFAPAILPLAAIALLSRVYYAYKSPGIVAGCLGLALAAKVILSVVLIQEFGVLGLALATTISATVAFALLGLFLSLKIGSAPRKALWGPLGVSIATSGMMLAALHWAQIQGGEIAVAVKGLIFVAGMTIAYMALPYERKALLSLILPRKVQGGP